MKEYLTLCELSTHQSADVYTDEKGIEQAKQSVKRDRRQPCMPRLGDGVLESRWGFTLCLLLGINSHANVTLQVVLRKRVGDF